MDVDYYLPKFLLLLTKVLTTPNIHVSVILAQTIKPAFFHYKDPSSNYRGPARTAVSVKSTDNL